MRFLVNEIPCDIDIKNNAAFCVGTGSMIPKPTYWAFAFYKDLYPEAVAKNEYLVATKSGAGIDLTSNALCFFELQGINNEP